MMPADALPAVDALFNGDTLRRAQEALRGASPEYAPVLSAADKQLLSTGLEPILIFAQQLRADLHER